MSINLLNETTKAKLKLEYNEDKHFSDIYKTLLKNEKPPPELFHRYKHYYLKDNLLTYSVIPGDIDGERLCIPKGQVRKEILFDYHNSRISGHIGYLRTYELIHRNYFWPFMIKEIKNYVDRCELCQKNKSSNQQPQGLLEPLPIPKKKWQQISMDLITGLHRTRNGNDSIFVVVDYLSKRAHFIATKIKIDSVGLAKLFMENIFKHHGLPDTIVSDRDPRFVSSFWSNLHRLLGTKLAMSSANHAETDGQTERTNRTLEQILRCYVNKNLNDWDDYLTYAEFTYNDTISALTGMTPFKVDMGQDPSRPGANFISTADKGASDFVKNILTYINIAKDSIQMAQDTQATYANKNRRDIDIQIGDYVWLHKNSLTWNTPKLGPIWFGPYKVLTRKSSSFKLNIPETRMHPTIHASHLKKFKNPINQPPKRNYKVKRVYQH